MMERDPYLAKSFGVSGVTEDRVISQAWQRERENVYSLSSDSSAQVIA